MADNTNILPNDQNFVRAAGFESSSTAGLVMAGQIDEITGRILVDNASGLGTVTSVSVVTANGVSGSVATSTTTPAITLTLGAITPSSLQVSGLTASELLLTDASKNIVSAPVATYPSPIELTYLKGATSNLQTQINALDSVVILKGTWDASAGTFPGGGIAQAGWSYIVSVTGTVDGIVFTQNDRIVAIVDNASTTIYAANWFKLDYTDQVLSVFSRTGAVTAADGDYSQSLITGLKTSDSPQFTGIELGHASDTTLTRVSAGVVAIEGVNIATISATQTLTNKRVTKRVVTTTDDATAIIDVDVTDVYELSAVANATDFSTSGTPTDGQPMIIRFKDAGVAKALTWNAIFVAIGCTLPTTTVAGKWHYVMCQYNTSATKWHALSAIVQA